MNFGEFYQTESVVHKLDPRLKLILMLISVTEIFFVKKLITFLLIFILINIFIIISRIPVRIFIKSMKNILFLILFTSLLNIFFTPQGNIVFKFYFLTATDVGIDIGIKSTVRLIIIIFITSLVMLTTSPLRLTDALVKILSPLKKFFNVPTNEISMILTIALRFIPVLSNELELIMKAQRARGIEFKKGKILNRIKNYSALLIPLFVSAFRRADELALAMEARCYNPDVERSSLNELKFKLVDLYVFILIIIFHIIIFLLRSKI